MPLRQCFEQRAGTIWRGHVHRAMSHDWAALKCIIFLCSTFDLCDVNQTAESAIKVLR